MQSILIQFAVFLIYSFLGWICETLFCSVAARKFINRGFLTGPFCPIYGFGAMIILLLFSGLRDHWLLLFLGSIVGTSGLEYLTSLILEKVFRLSLWDYSQRRWNLHGRICLRNSLLFGIMSVLMVQVIHPHVVGFLLSLPENFLLLGFLVLAVYFIGDTAVTIHALVEITREAGARQMELEGLAAIREQYRTAAQQERRHKHIQRLQKLYRRLAQAFPRMRSLRSPEEFRDLLAEAQDRMTQAADRIKSRKKASDGEQSDRR